jgi:hypothetical protein
MKLIAALNSLNTPWIAIVVIVIGMGFDIACKHNGIAPDAATGVIGAGIGLLTGQALSNKRQEQEQVPSVAPKAPAA